IAQLDSLLGGGLEAGTSTLIVGAPGTGKTTLAALFLANLAFHGERGSFFMFDESPQTLLARCKSLHIRLPEAVESGLVAIQQVDPAELTPGEFTHGI